MKTDQAAIEKKYVTKKGWSIDQPLIII